MENYEGGKINMPLVTVKAIEGRTTEQKRKLVRDITEAVVKHFETKPESVIVDIIEFSRENLAKAGKLFIDS
jgi:4-oxalocrotonate tautomerase